MNKEDINALDEIHKGACMGMDAINYIIDKTKDNNLRNYLKEMYKNYKNIASKIEEVYPKYNDDKPHSTNIMNKVMTWYGVEMKTLTDKSISKISELLLQGVNMGIIEGKKIMNNKNLNKEVNSIISIYVRMQEESVETLKKYL